MKPNQGRIAEFWCKLMHESPMWPAHGHYECRTCGCLHHVSWDQPSPQNRGMMLPVPASQPQSAFANSN